MEMLQMVAGPGADEPRDVGSRLELFVDDYLIREMKNLELRLHSPIEREEVFHFDAPWEGVSSGYVTIFKDGDRYRMYYRGSDYPDGANESACTAESRDGIHWGRPNVGLFEHGGSRDNNIVWQGPGAHAFTPFRDINPAAYPEELYKAVGPYDGTNRTPLYGYVSPDGYSWRRIGEEPIITDGNFDSQNVAFWDAERGEYVCYFRAFREGFRDIKRATSADFITWSAPEWLDYPGVPPEQLYTNAVQPYPRAPHIYVGFPKRFLPERKLIESHNVKGVSDGVFMSSRDGISFRRWQEAFLRPGVDWRNWTDRNSMASWGIAELTPGELSIYYSRHMRHSTIHLLRTTLRTDGFVSVHAGATTGALLTHPLAFTGSRLKINFATSAAGGVRVGLIDSRGRAIPGRGMEQCPVMYGDSIEHVVEWESGSDLTDCSSQPVRLQFELSDADLYAIRFSD